MQGGLAVSNEAPRLVGTKRPCGYLVVFLVYWMSRVCACDGP